MRAGEQATPSGVPVAFCMLPVPPFSMLTRNERMTPTATCKRAVYATNWL